MFFEKKDGVLRGKFKDLPDGKYKCSKVSEWRSNLQNNLYWGWYIPHIKEGLADFGILATEKQIHEDLKEILLQDRKYNHITGTYKKYVKSTANLNKKQFTQYLQDIEKFVMDKFHFSIPTHDIFGDFEPQKNSFFRQD